MTEEKISSGYIHTNGYRMHYLKAGRADRPPALLIHGLGVSSQYFVPLLTHLSKSNHVYAVDLVGFGKSVRPPHALSIEQHAEVLRHFIQKVMEANPIIVGHSMGCQIAAELATAVDAPFLVLIGPTTYDKERTIPMQIFRLLQTACIEPWSLNKIQIKDYLVCNKRIYIGTLRPMLRHKTEDCLQRLSVPCLILRGSRDPLARRLWVERLQGCNEKVQATEIPYGTHGIHFTHAQEVTDAILKSLA